MNIGDCETCGIKRVWLTDGLCDQCFVKQGIASEMAQINAVKEAIQKEQELEKVEDIKTLQTNAT